MSLEVGDRVRLLRLDDWFFADMEPVVVTFLKSCVGQEYRIVGFDEYGHVELECTPEKAETSFHSHTVWVSADWVEKV